MRRREIGGITDEGSAKNAIITIGLRVGKRRRNSVAIKKGHVISTEQAAQEILALRAKQVGRLAAASTIKRCEGRWQGIAEPTLECELKFFPSAREQRAQTFERHVGILAEQIAERLGQKEVIVEMGGRTYRANAPRERGPKPLRAGGKRIR